MEGKYEGIVECQVTPTRADRSDVHHNKKLPLKQSLIGKTDKRTHIWVSFARTTNMTCGIAGHRIRVLPAVRPPAQI